MRRSETKAAATLEAIKVELRKRVHNPIVKTGAR